jgi:thioredoxin reductase (NADPH)
LDESPVAAELGRRVYAGEVELNIMDMGNYDVVIIGGGLAGLTAALFAARYGHSTLVLEPFVPGGHLVNVKKIEDFPGFPSGVAGYDLGPLVQEQAANQGAEFQMAEVQSLKAENLHWLVDTNRGRCRAKAVIIAAGSHPKELGVPGAGRLRGKGVSHCASCDGPLFSDQVVGVVGGGDSALQEALALADYASLVIVFHHHEGFSGQHTFQQRVLNHSKIMVWYKTVVEEILGEDRVMGVRVRDEVTGEKRQVELSGVFVYVGMEPNTAFLKSIMRLDSASRIPTDVWMRTELSGVFAVGDIRQDSAAQAITSAGDGAVAAIAAHKYIKGDKRSKAGASNGEVTNG